MLKSYMKRLEEAGHNPNDIQPSDDHTHMYDEQVEQSIVIRMKDHTEYLGMFEYKKDNEQKIFKALVYGKFSKEFSVAHFPEFLNFYFSDLKPKLALQMLPGLPAYILFMMVRYTDHINNDAFVRSLIQGAISTIKKSIKKRGANDIEMNVMWLSNLLRFVYKNCLIFENVN